MRTLRIRFKNEIAQWEVPLFRGAVISALGEDRDWLFHNHDAEGFRYSYPLIQYKRIHGKAAIVAIGEGTEAMGQFFSRWSPALRLGERELQLEVEDIKAEQVRIQLWQDEFTYSLRKWLPLNQTNYGKFQQMEGVRERCEMLERTLTANMLSFLKGIGIHIDEELRCTITQLNDPYDIKYKGVKMKGFDIEFRTNLSLPDFIGLGKGVSLGNGTVTRKSRRDDNLKRPLFLLGGRDLEMQCIKEMLQKHGENYVDAKLAWNNAFLSAYSDVLTKNYQAVYGIELHEDVQVPENYHKIDHHNEYSDRESSLKQVADVLGVSLSRYEQLVSANDSGYIPAMMAMDATETEIQDVRRADRMAQGVTDAEEIMAEKAVEVREIVGDLQVVKTESSHFSPVCDRLYPYNKLLVYNDEELVYYGEGQGVLIQHFRELIDAGKAYYGGGDSGFFGLAKGCFTEKEIADYVILIKQTLQ